MKKNTLILLVVVFSILMVSTGCTKADTNNEDTLSFTERNNQMYISAVIMPGVKIVTTEVTTKVATKINTTTVETEDYGEAITTYDYRFQFANCSGNPGSLTMKLGTKFMIDNRDNASHQISIGTNIYKLEAYDFAIVNIQKVGDFIITCDGGGAAHALIQK